MRSPRCFAPVALLAAFFSIACSNKSPDSTTSPSASPSAPPSPSGDVVDAPPSPFSVLLESPKPLVVSGLAAGIAAANDARTHLATALAGGEATLGPMPDGLPADGKIVRFDGKLPNSLWLSFEVPAESKGSPKNPLFRFDTRKKTWKKWTDDWKPLLSAWSNQRVLSMSTSSGKLKIKVVEPHRDKPDADWPSAHLGDDVCEKSLKLEALTTWPVGDVFAAGHCKAGGTARKYVLLHWPAPNAAPAASASSGPVSAPAPSASAAARPDGSAMPDQDPPSSEIVDGGVGDAGEAVVPDIGVHGEVWPIPDAPSNLSTRSLVAQADKEVWVLGQARDGAPQLYRSEGKTIVADLLPKAIEGEAKGIAVGDDGTLWFVSTHEIWKRPLSGEWEKVPPPSGHWREAGPKWEFSGVWAAKNDVWIAGKHASTKADHYVVLRLRSVKETTTMP